MFQQIHNPNEFDMMLKLQSPSRLKMTELDQYHGLFYEVALSRPTRSHIRSFLLEDGITISATKIISEMHRLVRKFISTYRGVVTGLYSPESIRMQSYKCSHTHTVYLVQLVCL